MSFSHASDINQYYDLFWPKIFVRTSEASVAMHSFCESDYTDYTSNQSAAPK